MVYEPREDSFLILKHIKDYAQGTVLDMGTGSGVLLEEASKYAEKAYGTDIDKKAIECAKKRLETAKINQEKYEIVESNLFSYFKDKKKTFDLIIFNPPYLPDDNRVKDIALDGGRHGYELIQRFINELPEYLKNDGRCLLLFSSFTNKDKIEQIIMEKCLDAKLVEKEKLDFEELYVYLIKKKSILIELEKEGVKDINYFAKGKRGIIFTGDFKHMKIAIKTENPNSKAIERIEHEANMLKVLNKQGIGPKLLHKGWGYFVYEFAKGVLFVEYIEKANKEEIKAVLLEILKQLAKLDELGISKEEMHHPLKHIIIGEKVIQIDFERAHHALKPQNITQFCDFLLSEDIHTLLKGKGFSYEMERLITLARDYKAGAVKAEKLINYILDS